MLKTILACLDSRTTADTVMRAAISLARDHNAHLVGLPTLEALITYPGVAMHVPDESFAAFQRSHRQELDAIGAAFKDKTRNEDFVSEWRVQQSTMRSAAAQIIDCAVSADLVVMAQEDPDSDQIDQRHTQDMVIRDSGRPVLVVPAGYTGAPLGNNIVLGWSMTREATRAAHDVLLVAKPGATVHIVSVGKGQVDELLDDAATDLAKAFARHGLKAEVKHREPHGLKIAEVLQKEAMETGADLIATGAFGHSRTYDFVIGATSRALLREASLPVLYAK